jgi:hypothetical protein
MSDLKNILSEILIKEGGKLFSQYGSVRVTTQEMHVVFEEIKNKIQSHISEIQLSKSLEDKQDHGDIDILLLSSENVRDFVKKELGDRILKDFSNSGQYSILYLSEKINKKVHVDFLYTNDMEQYQSMTDYYSYNDFSNIIGRFAKRLDFSYQSNGFFKMFDDSKGQRHYFLITSNLKEGLKILGYDPSVMDNIKNVEDIINFCISSPLIDSDMFKHETKRERDSNRRRPATELLVNRMIQVNKKASITDPDFFFKKYYNIKYEEFLKEKERINKELQVSMKYTVDWVMKTFGLTPGPKLGKVISHLKSKFKDTLQDTSEEKVKTEIENFLKNSSDEVVPEKKSKPQISEELKLGIEIEFENTQDNKLAEIIAHHHLDEDSSYYTKMKNMNLDENETNDSKYRIFVDMDGVLVDWNRAFKDSNKEQLDAKQYELKYGKHSIWKIAKGYEWWATLPWMEDGHYLWDFLKTLPYDVQILSSPSLEKSCVKAKHDWVRKNLGSNVKVNLIIGGKHKVKFARSKNDILIDDKLSNINSWNTIGTGILHTSFLDTKRKLESILGLL